MFSCLSCSRVKDYFKNGPTSVAILKFIISIKQLILIIISILSKKSALSNYKSNFIIAKLILSKYNNGFICTGPDYVDQRFEFLIYYTQCILSFPCRQILKCKQAYALLPFFTNFFFKVYIILQTLQLDVKVLNNINFRCPSFLFTPRLVFILI